jgi:signal peptidase I
VSDGAEPDLRARIRARVTERRAAERQPAGEPAAGDLPAGEPAGQDPAARTPIAASAGRRRPSTPHRRRSPLSRLVHALWFAIAVAVTVVVLRGFVIASYYIPSASMEPTLHGCRHCEPDLVVVDKLSYRFGSVGRSDVVVFDRPPLAPPEDTELIKRVIGLPGETISGHDGKVFVGAKALPEPYVNPACGGTGDFAPVTVPAGEYFVMGDNRCDSLDSRVFGVIPGSSIVGRSVAVSWPVKHLRWL